MENADKTIIDKIISTLEQNTRGVQVNFRFDYLTNDLNVSQSLRVKYHRFNEKLLT